MNVIFEIYIQGPNTVVEKAEAVLRVTAIARIDIYRLDVPLFCIRWTLNAVNAEYCCSGSPNLFRSTTTGQLNEVTEVLDVDPWPQQVHPIRERHLLIFEFIPRVHFYVPAAVPEL